MSKKRISLMLCVCVVAISCTTTKRRPVSGTNIDPDHVEKIVPGKTTKQEIEKRFGPPTRVEKTSDGQEYRYSYVGFVDKKLEALVYMRAESDKENKLLRLPLEDDVVTAVYYTNSLDPDEDMTKE